MVKVSFPVVRVDPLPSRLPVAVPLADSKSQTHRRAVLSGDVLTITHGHNRKDISSYRVRELTYIPFPARGFVLEKLAGGTDAEAENYAVLIDPSTHHSCECKGFLRWDRCKHIDTLVELLAEGALDPTPARTDIPIDLDPPIYPFPSAEQLEADAAIDGPDAA